MTTPAWPATLPQYFQEQGYEQSMPNVRIESEVDDGPPKVRKRFTTNYIPVQGVIWCSADQNDDFDDFYMNDLDGGTANFTWVNPITQAAKTFRFRGGPPKKTVRGEIIAIQIALWQLD